MNKARARMNAIEEIMLFCEKCERITPHTEHGFRGHNYRLTCDLCEEINYSEIA